MLVVFSHDAFFQRYGGVSRCIVELVRRLNGQGQPWRILASRYGSHFLDHLDKDPGQVTGRWAANAPGRIPAAFCNEPGFVRTVATLPGAVVHRSYYPVIDLLPAGVPVVVTLHDMYWEAPGVPPSLRYRMHSWLKRKALVRADRIVCISQFTLDELARVWPDLATKAEVIYHGVSPLASVDGAGGARRDTFVFVGDRGNRKNFATALAGLARSGLDGHELLCVGGGGFTKGELALIADLGLTGRVVQRDADDAALACHYGTSAALLYPSVYEGFGMPLLEAMLHGCPVIAARASCLPEIGGDAARYADAHDPDEWAAMLRDVVQEPVRAAMISRGRRRAEDFAWEDVARRYVQVYRGVAEASAR